MSCFRLAWLLLALVMTCRGNAHDFDPHKPASYPFFEGWYSRITTSSGLTLAFGIGSFPGQDMKLHDAACFLLVQPANSADTSRPDSNSSPLISLTQYLSHVNITSPASSPSTSPGYSPPEHQSSPDFSIVGASKDGSCSMKVNTTSISMRFVYDGKADLIVDSLHQAAPSLVPWSGSHDSPEAWLSHFPGLSKLHYYIYTLSTPVRYSLLMTIHHPKAGTAAPPASAPTARPADGRQLEEAASMVSHNSDAAAAKESLLRAPWLEASSRQRSAGQEAGGGSLSSMKGHQPVEGHAMEGEGYIHMEKNWGRGFPSQWVWTEAQARLPQHHKKASAPAEAAGASASAEGTAEEAESSGASSHQQAAAVSFMLAGGPLPHALDVLLPPITQYVFSYHQAAAAGSSSSDNGKDDDALEVTVDLANPAVFVQQRIDGCAGTLILVLHTALHIVYVDVSAASSSFGQVTCPTPEGFTEYSEQSFSATANIAISKRPFFFAPASYAKTIANASLPHAALEFGGAFMCQSRYHEEQQAGDTAAVIV